MLRPYYRELAKVARHVIDPTPLKAAYIRQNLLCVQRYGRDSYNESIENEELLTYEAIVDYLDQQAIYVQENDFEKSLCVDFISRVFGSIVEDGVFDISQTQINATRQALFSIWNLCHFEQRFIEPIAFGYQEKLER